MWNHVYPKAIIVEGYSSKVWSGVNAGRGVILHSMEGYIGYALQMVANPNVEVSWHFSIGQDGQVYQHFDLLACPWHAGSRIWNQTYIGIEHEGSVENPKLNLDYRPWTEAEILASVELVQWIQSTLARIQLGWDKLERGVNLFEHNEINMSTTCPNNLVPWERYKEREVFSPYEEAALRGLIQWREDVVPLIDRMLDTIVKLADDEIVDDQEVKTIKDQLAAIHKATGGN